MAGFGGRPRLIASPEEAWERGQAFFKARREKNEPLTITGLALALGLSGKEALWEYGKRPEFFDVIKTLKSEVEECYERNMSGPNATGSIFVMKNLGWRDTAELDINAKTYLINTNAQTDDEWERTYGTTDSVAASTGTTKGTD